MADLRKLALQDFINDEPETKELGIYFWRGKTYQVMPYLQMQTRGMKADSFIKHKYGNKTYAIREMSEQLLKNYYIVKGADFTS